jgi:hypothetical protein
MNCRITSLLLACSLLLLASPSLAARSAVGPTAWVSSNHIQVIDIDSGRVVGRLPLGEFIHEMQFDRSGEKLYVGSSKALRVVDSQRMAFTDTLARRTTKALAVSNDGSHVVAIHPGDAAVSQASRKAGTPLPLATLTVYSTASNSPLRSWPVPAMSFDVALSPAGDQVYVLDAPAGQVQVYSLQGELVEEIVVAPTGSDGKPVRAMLGWMALSPDGSTLVVPVTTATGALLAEVDLAARRAPTARLRHSELRATGRIQGLAWNQRGDEVLITSAHALCRWSKPGGEQVWEAQAINYVDIEPVPGSSNSVVVAPVFSEANKSGGVSVLSATGEVLRSIELLDMSPFFVAVRP